MSTITLSEMKERILKVMNEYSINGELVASTDENRMDYDLRMNSLIDMHQRKMATSALKAKKILKSYTFTQYSPENKISGDRFDITRYEGNTLYFNGGINPKSYTIQVDGSCTITVEQSADAETYTTVEATTVTITTFGTFESVCGNISPTEDYYVRIKVAGTYHFNVRGVALYDVTYPSDDDVPDYEAYRKISMPSDFYQFRNLVLNGQTVRGEEYGVLTRFGVEGRNYLYLPWDMRGEIRVHYYAYPTVIDDDTLESATLDVDDEVIDVIVYGVALDLIDDDNTVLYQKLLNKYNEFFAGIDNNIVRGGGTVKNNLFSCPKSKYPEDYVDTDDD